MIIPKNYFFKKLIYDHEIITQKNMIEKPKELYLFKQIMMRLLLPYNNSGL